MKTIQKDKYDQIINQELSFPEIDEYLEENGWNVEELPKDGNRDDFQDCEEAEEFDRALDHYSSERADYYRDWTYAKALADAIANDNINKEALDCLLNHVGKRIFRSKIV